MNNKINLDGKRIITIVKSGDTVISENDSEMDIRARCAVKSAIEKAEICKKPVARYDAVLKKHIWNLQTEKVFHSPFRAASRCLRVFPILSIL